VSVPLQDTVAGKVIRWTERRWLVRSLALQRNASTGQRSSNS
jgi:hypothetical protein